eukprot:3066063-Rhodomonas_salina.1
MSVLYRIAPYASSVRHTLRWDCTAHHSSIASYAMSVLAQYQQAGSSIAQVGPAAYARSVPDIA